VDIIGQLYPLAPYDFALSARLMWLSGVLDIERSGEYWRALTIDDTIVLLRVVNTGTIHQPQLTVYRAAATGPVRDDILRAHIGRMLNTDLDLQPFYDRARQDERLWSVIEPLLGFKPVRAASVFEALITAIIEQQIALRLAKRGEHWLMRWTNNHIDHDGFTYYTFPRPDQLATATIDDLLPLKITRRRMGVIIDTAQQMTQHMLGFDGLEPEVIRQTLLQINGVGNWTATWTVIRATGAYVAGAENDVALQAAIHHYFYAEPGRATPQRVVETLRPYGDFAGAAAFHILMHWASDHLVPGKP
jgi:DNA-3-methyladenine glycosylase II